jgi:serine/threonine-protein kinase
LEKREVSVSEQRAAASDNLGAAHPQAATPTMIGRYAMYGVIAAGGMATVHLGRLLGPVGFSRTVAIKKLHEHLAHDPDFVLAFVDEARLAARIRHPNVVPTIDVIAEQGHLLLVMEYVAGESLLRLLRAVRARGARTPPRIAAAIVSSACHGLHAAHEATTDRGQELGIVHRDVSPHNIMVGSDGVARVLDFGVAKAMGRFQSTAAGTVKGKVAYMAPEQIRGGTVDRRTDVYAAGVVLWEALTGRRLFKGESDVVVFGLALEGCSTPPSTYVPGLPPGFDDVTMQALRLDPAQRFGTARDMALELEACAGIATPSEVAAWVSSLAADLLGQRARAVAEVESASDIFATATGFAPASGVPPAAPATPPLVVDEEPTSVSDVSDVQAPRPDAPGVGTRRSHLALAAAAGGAAAIVLGAIGLLALRTGNPSPSPVAPGTTTATATPPEPATTATAPVAEPTSAPSASTSTSTATLLPSPTATPPASVAVTAPPRVPATKTSPTTPKTAAPDRPASPGARAAPSPAPNCVPPYTVDARGFRVLKPECL